MGLNLFRGEPLECISHGLRSLSESVMGDLVLPRLEREWVIEAVDRLVKEFPKGEYYIDAVAGTLTQENLRRRCEIELSDPLNELHPLGVLLHIGAGNAMGLSAYSVIEGLLAGNINVLKCAEDEGDISAFLLKALVDIEPRLKPYVYVFHVGSQDIEAMRQLIAVSNAVVVWGSDAAIKGVRANLPPNVQIIEWGHKLSFSYFTEEGTSDCALMAVADEICRTDQLYCTTPQCVFFETDSKEQLDVFAQRFSDALNTTCERIPAARRTFEVAARLTYDNLSYDMEHLLGSMRVYSHLPHDYRVMVTDVSELKGSPLYRHIWVAPIARKDIIRVLWPHKGHLQTASVSCSMTEKIEIETALIRSGVTRLTSVGNQSIQRPFEPHDGFYVLSRYTKRIYREDI